MKRVAGGLALGGALLLAAFLLGAIVPYTFGAPDVVHIGGPLSFRPAKHPILHGLFYAANLAVFEVALVIGLTVTATLWRAGLLMVGVAVGLDLAGLAGLFLAVLGGPLGLNGGQRGGMAVVAVTLGGMGALMTVAIAKERLRKGRRRERKGG